MSALRMFDSRDGDPGRTELDGVQILGWLAADQQLLAGEAWGQCHIDLRNETD